MSLSFFPCDQRIKAEILLPRLRDQNDLVVVSDAPPKKTRVASLRAGEDTKRRSLFNSKADKRVCQIGEPK